MSFSSEWEETFKAGGHMSVWPWSELVSYVMRYARPFSGEFRVLELGPGVGANVPFFLSLGVRYFAIEGSALAAKMLCERFPELKDNIKTGDFTKELSFEPGFDLVVDRAALTHNDTGSIKKCIPLARNVLKKGGMYIGIDWFSTLHSEYSRGEEAEDVNTRRNYMDGQFRGVGRVHFSDKAHLVELFDGFAFEVMELKTVKREIPDGDYMFASWNFAARKD